MKQHFSSFLLFLKTLLQTLLLNKWISLSDGKIKSYPPKPLSLPKIRPASILLLQHLHLLPRDLTAPLFHALGLLKLKTHHSGARSSLRLRFGLHGEGLAGFQRLIEDVLAHKEAPVAAIKPGNAAFCGLLSSALDASKFLAVGEALAEFASLLWAVLDLAVLDRAVHAAIGPDFAVFWNLRHSLRSRLQNIQDHCFFALFIRAVDEVGRVWRGQGSFLFLPLPLHCHHHRCRHQYLRKFLHFL